MSKKEVLGIYLEQYKLMEEDFMELIKYVSLSGKNFATFSPKLLSMFLLTCSEIDSILDEYVRQYDFTNEKKYGFCQKIQALCDKRNLSAERVSVREISGPRPIAPFGKLSSAETTDWWHDYNLVKHNRMRKDDKENWNYEKANLRNVLYSMAGLYIILHIFFRDELLDEDIISSKLFKRVP